MTAEQLFELWKLAMRERDFIAAAEFARRYARVKDFQRRSPEDVVLAIYDKLGIKLQGEPQDWNPRYSQPFRPQFSPLIQKMLRSARRETRKRDL